MDISGSVYDSKKVLEVLTKQQAFSRGSWASSLGVALTFRYVAHCLTVYSSPTSLNLNHILQITNVR